MANKANVKKNAVFNTIKTVFGIIYPLITFPYISRVLKAENVGKINFGNSIVSYFSLAASLGVATYAIRECSKVKENRDDLSKTASQILSINVFSTLFSYIALIITLIFAKSLQNYRLLICIQSSTILFSTLGADWLNTAMEDFRYITIRTIAFQILSLVLMFIFVRKPEHYILYAIISVVASSGSNILNIFYRKKYCTTKFTLDLNLKKHLPPIMLLFSMLLAQTIYTSSDTTILGLIKGDVEVGLYSTSVKIYNIVNQMVASVAYVVMPQLAAGFAKNDYDEINKLLKYALNFIIVLGLPCLVGINAITKEIIYVIAGEEYLRATTSLHILTIALLFSFIGGWFSNMTLLPSGREKVCLYSCAISSTVNIILNFILIPYYGLNAAAFTTMLAELIGIIFVSRFLDPNIHIDGLTEMLKGPILGCACIFIVSIIVKMFVNSYYLITIITIVLSILVYALILYITKNEFFLEMLKPFVSRIKNIF